jgi:hypothetical protein
LAVENRAATGGEPYGQARQFVPAKLSINFGQAECVVVESPCRYDARP